MQYNNRAILSMIASALNPCIPDVRGNHEHIPYYDQLAELEATPDRNALIFFIADGREFRINVTEVV